MTDDPTKDFFPDPPPKPKRRRRWKTLKNELEGAVVKECLLFLQQHPNVIYIERRNTGALQLEGGGFIRFGAVGAADIWCLVKTPLCIIDDCGDIVAELDDFHLQHIEIECKRRDGKGKPSPDQKKFQEFCDQNTIPYFLVTCKQELRDKLQNLLDSD